MKIILKEKYFLGIIALVLSYLLKIDKIEFIIIIIVIGLVLVSEIINTAIERLVDLVSPKYNKLAGEVKRYSSFFCPSYVYLFFSSRSNNICTKK